MSVPSEVSEVRERAVSVRQHTVREHWKADLYDTLSSPLHVPSLRSSPPLPISLRFSLLPSFSLPPPDFFDAYIAAKSKAGGAQDSHNMARTKLLQSNTIFNRG